MIWLQKDDFIKNIYAFVSVFSPVDLSTRNAVGCELKSMSLRIGPGTPFSILLNVVFQS